VGESRYEHAVAVDLDRSHRDKGVFPHYLEEKMILLSQKGYKIAVLEKLGKVTLKRRGAGALEGGRCSLFSNDAAHQTRGVGFPRI